MLKGIDSILTPELLMHLCAMGHNEWVAVVDANFTADFLARRTQPSIPLVRLAGLGLERVSSAVLSVLPLADDVPFAASYMHVDGSAHDYQSAVQQAVVRLVCEESSGAAKVEAIERFAFYERIKAVSLIIQTGETAAYGNALFCKGFVG
jgi:L-fucose mutarotase